MLKVESLSVFYGQTQALWDISLNVEAKSITAILGSNGAGKSTLFNLITGIELPTSGEICFKNQQLNSLKPHQRAAIGLSHRHLWDYTIRMRCDALFW